MERKEKKQRTYLGCAEIRLSDTDRKEKLIQAAENAGFIVDCAEAFNVSMNGSTSETYWAITVYYPGSLDRIDRNFEKGILADVWKGL